TASNPYVTILGPMKSAAKRISIMGICNGVAGIVAPAVLGAVILSNADEINEKLLLLLEAEKAELLNELARKIIIPYLVVSAILAALAFAIYKSSLPEIDESSLEDHVPTGVRASVGKTSIFQFPHLLFGVLTLFVYTGVEVIAANT